MEIIVTFLHTGAETSGHTILISFAKSSVSPSAALTKLYVGLPADVPPAGSKRERIGEPNTHRSLAADSASMRVSTSSSGPFEKTTQLAEANEGQSAGFGAAGSSTPIPSAPNTIKVKCMAVDSEANGIIARTKHQTCDSSVFTSARALAGVLDVVDSIIIDCAEGSRRFCNEKHIKLSTLRAIACTSINPLNWGGLASIAYQLGDQGAQELLVIGPPGINQAKESIDVFYKGRNPTLQFKQVAGTEPSETEGLPQVGMVTSTPAFTTSLGQHVSWAMRGIPITIDHDMGVAYHIVVVGTVDGASLHNEILVLPFDSTRLRQAIVNNLELNSVMARPAFKIPDSLLVFLTRSCNSSDIQPCIDRLIRTNTLRCSLKCLGYSVEKFKSSIVETSSCDRHFWSVHGSSAKIQTSFIDAGLAGQTMHGFKSPTDLPRDFCLTKGKLLVSWLPATLVARIKSDKETVLATLCSCAKNDRRKRPRITSNYSTLDLIKQKFSRQTKPLSKGSTKVTFLGTGAAAPSKHRNCTSILVFDTTSMMNCGILLDCGEGTFGSLQRHCGPKLDLHLKSIKYIWISHLHADHHCGLPTLLMTYIAKNFQLPAVIANSDVKLCIKRSSRMLENIEFLDPEDMNLPLVQQRMLAKCPCLTGVQHIPVLHCKYAGGIRLDFGVSSVVFSGDTIPCKQIIAASRGCSVLIHEATFGSDRSAEARAKRHSTVEEAIQVARESKSKILILTHFSQRYAGKEDDSGLFAAIRASSSDALIAYDGFSFNLKSIQKSHLEDVEIMDHVYCE